MRTKKFKWATKVAIILAVIAIPLAYSLFYLGAFWDPYGRLNQLPVAVVNEDSGAVVNGKQRNLGGELVNELQSGNELKWVLSDAADAETGLSGTSYYAVLTIPKSFSGDVASADSADRRTAQITYSANEKHNFLAAQILNRAVLEVEEKLETKIDGELTAQLTGKLKDAPDQLQELSGGLSELSDGALKLDSGISELSHGQGSLQAGASQLDGGLSELSDGAKTLSQNIAALHSGISQTKDGVIDALPSMSGADGQLMSLNESMRQLVAGASSLSDGLTRVSDGASQLSTAASSETSGLPALIGGIDQTNAGAAKLSAGLGSYVDSVDTMLDQNKSVISQLGVIYASTALTDSQKIAAVGQLLGQASSPEIQQQLQTLAQSGSVLKAGAAAVTSGTGQLKASEKSLSELSGGLSDLSASLQQLNDGAAHIAGGVSILQAKASSLSGISEKLGDLTTTLNKLDAGSQQLYNGSLSLTMGLESAKAGSEKLVDGGAQLRDGTNRLQNGAKTLSDSLTTAKDSVDSAIAAAKTDLKATDGLAAFASDPVEIKASPANPVPDYGTAFAPYFISLSLYVGALIMFVGIYLDNDEKIPLLSRDSGRRFVRVGAFALIGLIQAIALALIVRYGLGIHLANPAAYYMSCILTSMVFIAIVEFLMVCLKDAGKFLSMLLLILQLTSCGGTFPMETVPKFFNVLYPFMPMTYSVKLFKETISGYDSKAAMTSALILAAVGIFFTVLTMLFSAGRNAKRKRLAAFKTEQTADCTD